MLSGHIAPASPRHPAWDARPPRPRPPYLYLPIMLTALPCASPHAAHRMCAAAAGQHHCLCGAVLSAGPGRAHLERRPAGARGLCQPHDQPAVPHDGRVEGRCGERHVGRGGGGGRGKAARSPPAVVNGCMCAARGSGRAPCAASHGAGCLAVCMGEEADRRPPRRGRSHAHGLQPKAGAGSRRRRRDPPVLRGACVHPGAAALHRISMHASAAPRTMAGHVKAAPLPALPFS